MLSKVGDKPNGEVSDAGEQSDAFVGEELTSEAALKLRRGAKTRGIDQAIDELWPNGIPPGLAAMERNRAILVKMESKGSSIARAPERAIQRVLKKTTDEIVGDITNVATCRVVVATCRVFISHKMLGTIAVDSDHWRSRRDHPGR